MGNELKSKPQDKSFYLRKLTKAGSARYLSVGAILPRDWVAVKVFVWQVDSGAYILRLEQIK